MKTQLIETFNTTADIKAGFAHAIISGMNRAKQIQLIKEAYLALHQYTGESGYWDGFVKLAAESFCETGTAIRVQMAEDWRATFENDDESYPVEWSKLPNDASFKAEKNAFIAQVARITGGDSFTVNRLTMTKIESGMVYEWKPASKTAKASGKPVTATGKGSKQGAIGAKPASPEQGASVAESVATDAATAEAALFTILKAFPELAIKKTVQREFQKAINTVEKRKAATTAKTRKQAA